MFQINDLVILRNKRRGTNITNPFVLCKVLDVREKKIYITPVRILISKEEYSKHYEAFGEFYFSEYEKIIRGIDLYKFWVPSDRYAKYSLKMEVTVF